MHPPTWVSHSGSNYVPFLLDHAPRLTTPSRSLQPNGLRVLGLIPGLLDEIERCPVDEMISYSVLPGDERELMRNKFPRERFDHGIEGVKRPVLLRALIEGAQARGVPVHFGHQLVDFQQHEDNVTVKFANGKTDEGSFVIGCDGLHSNTRICLFGEEEASFTGLTQVSSSLQYTSLLDTRLIEA